MMSRRPEHKESSYVSHDDEGTTTDLEVVGYESGTESGCRYYTVQYAENHQ